MATSDASSNWAAERGKKWAALLSSMEAMLAPVNDPLIGALDLDKPCRDKPCRIAEIGCGGGGTALEILRRAPAGSIVHGFDISPDNIEAARGRVQSERGDIAFEVADAGLFEPAEPYDRLVSRFGIMFFEDPHAAFRNLARWLTPGGRFVFAAWGSPAENPWATVVRDAVAEVVEVPRPDLEAPGPFRYAEAGKLIALLEQSGFGELEVRDWRGRLPMGGGLAAQEAAAFAVQAFSNLGELLAAAGDAAMREAKRLLTAHYAEHLHDGIVEMSACVHIVTGSVPKN
jgi:SAM-dependent methyltransferase